MKPRARPSAIGEVLRYMTDLEASKELLDLVWDDLGPYGSGKLTPATLRALQCHYRFDDSE